MNQLDRLISSFVKEFPIEDCMRLLQQITTLNRYQASQGIQQAAALVVRELSQTGLEVQQLDFPVAGGRDWWTFRSPVPWTPVSASLEIINGPQKGTAASCDGKSCALATYSAPVEDLIGPLVLPTFGQEEGDLRGAIAIVENSGAPLPDMVRHLESARCAGFVIDMGSDESAHRGTVRIELPSDTSLFGFSMPTSSLMHFRAAASAKSLVRVRISVQRAASMPVVVAHLPGASSREIWITAHIWVRIYLTRPRYFCII